MTNLRPGLSGSCRALVCSSVLMLSMPTLSSAAADAVQFHIAAQPLVQALKAFAEQADVQLLYKHEVVERARANPVVGSFDKWTALGQLLQGTGLEIVATGDDAATITIAEHAGSQSQTSMTAAAPAQASMAQADPVAGKVELQNSSQRSKTSDALASESGRRALATESGRRIEEVIVTAQHREERLREVPMGITALTGEALSKAQQRSFEDYAALVPGLSLLQGGNGIPGSNRLSLRGLNADGVGSTVAVYVDDAPIGSSSAVANGAVFASNFDPWDMQRIEVLRGPQGMFYGASSEGGLIKFVTNAPDPSAMAGAVEVGGETVAGGGNGWLGKGMLNLPLGEKAAFRVSAFTEHQPGFVDDTLLDKSDVNSSEKNGARASFLFLPASNLEIRLTALHQKLSADGTSNVDADSATRQPVEGEFTHRRAVDELGSYLYDNFSATVNWDLGWANVFSGTGYSHAKNTPFVDVSFGSFDGAGTSVTEFFSNPDVYPSSSGLVPSGPVGMTLSNRATVKKFTQEFRLQSPSDRKVEWELGAFFTREAANLNQPYQLVDMTDGSAFGPSGFYFFSDLDSIYKEWAGFGSLTYSFTEQFDVQVGGRWARNEQSAMLMQSSGLFELPPTYLPGTSESDKFLYSLAPRWHINDRWMVYARVASGYQPGGMNILPIGAPPEVPLQFLPDSTVNYELGTRVELFDGRVSLDLTAFRIDWSKVQLNQIVTTAQGDFGVIGNGGKAASQGVEWSVQLAPFEGLALSLTGAYIDATLTTDAPVVSGVAGDRLPGAPEWSATLDGEYSWPMFADYSAYLGGTWSYVGDQVSSFATFSDTSTVVSGYSNLNLRAGLQHGPWTVSLYAKNVTDKRTVLIFSDSDDPGSPGDLIFNQPRTLGMAVSTKFWM